MILNYAEHLVITVIMVRLVTDPMYTSPPLPLPPEWERGGEERERGRK
jgi:hypothetical protein